MSWGRDVRVKEITMVGDDAVGREPQLLPPTRQAIRAAIVARTDAYTPEWTNRRAGDAGVALVHAYGALREAVNVRLNRVPQRLVLEHLGIAGVRALQARAAHAVLAIDVSPRARAPLSLPAGTSFQAAGGDPPVVLEMTQGCEALPGAIAAVAVLADGLTVSDKPGDLGGLAPFGRRPRAPAELWLGIDSPLAPRGLLTVAVELVLPAERPAASAVATTAPAAPPTLRWEALTAAGAAELPVERDETAGLSRSGVLALRADTPAPWTPRPLPGRRESRPLLWLRARLVTSDYPDDRRLARVTLNGVAAIAARSVRGEVLEALDRPVSGRSRYRLSQIPVVPDSVLIDIADPSSDPFGLEQPGAGDSAWEEVDDLGARPSDARCFELDATTGIVTFGDGVHGRAVPDGFRNVVARRYETGGGTAGLPAPGDAIQPRASVPDLAGATVLTITSGADAEPVADLVRRGPGRICSRGRAVAPADYAELALGAEGVDVARAHCLPVTDPGAPGAVVAGVVGVVVVPRTRPADGPPLPTAETLQAVADHLARGVGVVGAEVVAVAPRYREIAVDTVLVARAGSDLAATGSAARDAIDAWLDPLAGYGGGGWPFGGAVRWDVLSRLLLSRLDALTAVSRLALRIDGRRLPRCTDAELAPGELVWPGAHIVGVIAEERP